MGSWSTRSEKALAVLVSERLGSDARHVLIGGLGMGFTLAAALASFAATVSIDVAELVPRIVEWARGPLAAIVGPSLDDPRVALRVADVHDIIAAGRAQYDAILLDVDNGPDGLIQLANDRLYCDWGLRAAHAALRPGGMLAIWSAYPDDAFGDRLRCAGFDVEMVMISDGETAAHDPHVIWLAMRSNVAVDRCD